MVNANEKDTIRPVASAYRRTREQLAVRTDVVGVGIGERITSGVNTHEMCVKVFVPRKIPLSELPQERVLPREVAAESGRPSVVDVEQMEPPVAPLLNVRSLARAEALPSRSGLGQPIAGLSGASLGNLVGTIGILARPVVGGRRTAYSLFVSCNHVLADYNRAILGTPVVAPSPLDGGFFPRNWIGSLAGYVPLRFGLAGSNFVDAAIGRLLLPQPGRNAIGGVGPITGVTPADEIRIGQTVLVKAGRTSGITTGQVTAIHATIKVYYWPVGLLGRNTFFFDQIVTTAMGLFGDSGSVAIDSHSRAAGLLFAGSATHTFFNYFDRIARQFQIEV
jgi:hypothetical protein